MKENLQKKYLLIRKKKLSDLRLQIAAHLNIPPNTFQICKSILGHPFKDENLTIEQYALYDGQSIFIKEGEPLEYNHIKLTFSLFNRDVDTFTPVEGTHIVNQDISIEEIRKLIYKLPSLVSLNVPDISFIRLRGQHAKKAGPVLFDGNTLKQMFPHLSDHQTIAIQILDKPEFLKPHQVLIQLHRWYPSKQELQEKGEDLVLPEGSNILALKKQIAIHQTEIIEQYISIARPYSFQLKNKNTLSSLLNWELDSETVIKDGDLILYKDIRDKEVEIEGYKSQDGHLKMEVSRPVEVGLKIHTVYDAEGRAKFEALLDKHKETQPLDTTQSSPQETAQSTAQEIINQV